MNHRTITTGVIALLLLVFAVVGTADHDDAQAQHSHQCQMIADGHWPESVNPHCEEPQDADCHDC